MKRARSFRLPGIVCSVVAIATLLAGTGVPAFVTQQVSAQPAATPWPVVGHDVQHSARSPYTGPQADYAKWIVDGAANSQGSPVIASDGTVYYGTDTHNPSDPGKLYAVNPNGTIKWAVSFGPDANIDAAPVIADDGTLYVTTLDSRLLAVNPNGTLKWSFNADPGEIYSSPTIASDGTIYFGSSSSKLYAVNPNGTLKWSFDTGFVGQSSPALAPDGTIYITSLNETLWAVNPNGTLKWSYHTDHNADNSPTVAPDGTVYVGTSFIDNTNFTHMYAVNPNGTTKWDFTMPHMYDTIRSSVALAADGTLYFGTHNTGATFYALNPNGTIKWSYPLTTVASPAVGGDGTVYIASANATPPYNATYALRPDGTFLWNHQHNGNSRGTPAIASDGTLYVLDGGGILTAFSTTPVTDTKPPVVTGQPTGTPYRQDWYNTNQVIAWTSTDPIPSSGTPTQPANTNATLEGQHTYTSGQSCDPAHNCATGTAVVKIDKTKPTATSATPSTYFPAEGDSFTLTVNGTDSLSGLANGEYFIDTDPGVGLASKINSFSGNTGTVTVNSHPAAGLHIIGARVRDNAGNWSAQPTYTFVYIF
jgi:outer membrane protein assembly factor BamB